MFQKKKELTAQTTYVEIHLLELHFHCCIMQCSFHKKNANPVGNWHSVTVKYFTLSHRQVKAL